MSRRKEKNHSTPPEIEQLESGDSTSRVIGIWGRWCPMWSLFVPGISPRSQGATWEGTPITSKTQQYLTTYAWAFATTLLSIFAFYYSYEALISPNPNLGKLFFSPSWTVFVINVLSQGVAFSLRVMYSTILQELRWVFASRTSGVSLSTFLGLNPATSLVGVWRLLWITGDHWFWCVQRLFYPLFLIFVSVILTISIDYQNVYTSITTIPVFAGLTPLNVTFAGLIPTSVWSIYYMQWAYVILGVSKYVVGVSASTCNAYGSDCTAVFLPGAIENARLQTGNLNSTLLNVTTFQEESTILINNAPGYQLEFFPLSSYVFEASECTIYGQEQNDGLQICVSSQNSTIVAGWSICPTPLYLTNRCFTDTSWTKNLSQVTSMNVLKRYSTVAYDSRNLSILSIISLSTPEVITINPQDYRTAFSLAFAPHGVISPSDRIMSNALIFEVGWILRLYQDDFSRSDYAPVTFLRGMLTVPLQFSVAAWQWVNATVFALNPKSDLYALPQDLKTTASSAQRTYRALSTKGGTVYAFIFLVSMLLIYEAFLLAVTVIQPEVAPNTSSFSEIDAVSKSACPLPQRTYVDYASDLQRSRLGNASSVEIVQCVRNRKVRVVETDGPGENDKSIVVAVENIGKDVSPLPGLREGVMY